MAGKSGEIRAGKVLRWSHHVNDRDGGSTEIAGLVVRTGQGQDADIVAAAVLVLQATVFAAIVIVTTAAVAITMMARMVRMDVLAGDSCKKRLEVSPAGLAAHMHIETRHGKHIHHHDCER